MGLDSGLILNGIIGGGVALGLARLLQAQYEARITDLKQRVAEQSGQIEKLLAANAEMGASHKGLSEAYATLSESHKTLAERFRSQAEALKTALAGRPTP